MKRKYEGVIVLDTKGKDEGVEELISRIGKEMEEEGVKLQQIDQLGKRQFSYPSNHIDSGFYVNYLFEAEPAVIRKLQARLSLIDDVHVQHYQVI